MKKFWEWMKSKKYGNAQLELVGTYNPVTNSYSEKSCIDTSIQMLIGYKIEYLSEKGIFIGLASGDNERRAKGYSFEDILEYSNRLNKKIIEMK